MSKLIRFEVNWLNNPTEVQSCRGLGNGGCGHPIQCAAAAKLYDLKLHLNSVEEFNRFVQMLESKNSADVSLALQLIDNLYDNRTENSQRE